MLRSIVLLFVLAAGLSAWSEEVLILEDLAKVDAFDCNIEILGQNHIRILTTKQNNRPSRYLDVDLGDQQFRYEATGTGWSLRKKIDLYKEAINPIFPSVLYGKEITALEFVKSEHGAKLKIAYNPSTVSSLWGMEFSCSQASGIQLDKKNACPNCLSSQK
jgi:hypothetical protein